MPATATIRPNVQTVEPGGQVSYEIAVRNTGVIVDQFSFEVLGDAAGWESFEPPMLSLFPGNEGTTRLTFSPPKSPRTLAGPKDFAVKVIPKAAPHETVVEEGILEVAKFQDVAAELVPTTTRGRRSAKSKLAVDNLGNTPVSAPVVATDPDDQLEFRVSPASISAEPGEAGFATLKARPKKSFLRGQPKTYPYQVMVQPEGAPEPVMAQGTMVQEAILPRWLLPALILLAALALLWAFVLKPTVESAAANSVADDLAAAQKNAADAKKAADAAGANAQQALDQLGASPTATVSPSPSPSAAPVTFVEDAFDSRLEVITAPGGTANKQFTLLAAPPGQTLSVTDMILQNPSGSRGTVRVQRVDKANNVTDLLVLKLDNFRDIDYHFVTPIIFGEGQKLRLAVACDSSQPACTSGLYFAGQMKKPAPSPSPSP